MPGWNRNSWGYHGDDGKYFEEEEYIVPYGPLYGAGDTVGCGINLVEQTLFFTCNGERLGERLNLASQRLIADRPS